MSRKLDDLSPSMREKAVELLARLVEIKVPVLIIDTKRTESEQRANIARGVSWTMDSRHLTGNAIDICPYKLYDSNGVMELNWNSDDPVWQKIGAIGESIGLTWGGRWTQRDMGHFELPATTSREYA